MDPSAQDGDLMDEDVELALALELSMQEITAADLGDAPTTSTAPPAATASATTSAVAAGGSAPTSGAAAAAPAPSMEDWLRQALQAAQALAPTAAPAHAPAAAAAAALQPNAGGLAAALQQFFGGWDQGAAGGFGAAAGADGAGASGRGSSARRAAPQPAATPLPGWALKLQQWHQTSRASPSFSASSVTLAGPEQLAALCGHLGEALQVKVVGDSAAIAAGTLFLKTSAAAGGGRELSAESLRSVTTSALLQRRVAQRDRLQALHRAHDALPAPAALSAAGGGVGEGVELASGVLCREALALLRDDGADLYTDTGAQTAAFVDALAGGPATMCEPFLEALLDAGAGAEAGAALWRRLLAEALKAAFAPAGRLADAGGFERPLAVLDRATCTTRLQQCLASMLVADVEAASRLRPDKAARHLEAACALAPLLGASPMPATHDAFAHMKTASPARQAFLETRGYPKNHGAGQSCRTVLQAMMARVQDGAGHVMLRLSRTKDGGLAREALLSWVAAVGRSNLVRLAFGEATEVRNQQDVADLLAGGSDGFLLNVTGGCLRLAQPFVHGWLELYRAGTDPLVLSLAASASASAAAAAGGPAAPAPPLPRWADLLDRHLSPHYYRTQTHRLGDLSAAINATGSRGAGGFTTDDDPPTTAPPLLLQGDGVGGEGGPSFMADVFFLSQLMLHVGVIPTIYRTRALMHRMSERYAREMGPGGGGGGGEDGGDDDEVLEPADVRGRDPWSNPLATELQLYRDCVESHLQEPLFADNLTAFAVLELDWVAWLVRGGAGDPAASLRLLPEWAVGDALDWLAAVLHWGRADLVASKPIALIMRAMVTMLNAPEVVRGAMLQNKIVNLLLAMLASQISNVQSREARGLALAPDRMSTGERALVGAVLGAPVTQRDLIPALLRAHVNAEVVVGLDVDKDSYDKYGMRMHIDNILEELIKDSVLKRCLTDLAAPKQPQQQQRDGNGTGSSSSSPPAAPGEPDLFSDYASGIVNTVMHYFKDGLDRLADIYAIERSKADAAVWSALPAAERQRKEDFYRGQQRAARGFLRMGVVNLKWLNTLTADPAIASAFLQEPLRGKAAFLVLSSLELLLGDACKKLRVVKPEQYGFDLPVLVGSVLALQLQLGQHPAFVEALVTEPDYSDEIMASALAHLKASHQAHAETRLTAFLARGAEIRARTGQAAGVGAPPPLKRPKSGEGLADPMDVDGTEPGSSGSDAAAAAAGLACEVAAAALPGPAPSAAELDAAYAAELGPLSVGEYDSAVPGGYFREMARLADQDAGSSKKKMRRLAKETADMQPGGRLALPCLAAAAIFVRQDGARQDKMRALISGPQGTPYEGGLFVFDVFFPAGYPADPPVMMVYNTGGGKARYNPNLYADGKVCLSLLGTYNSGHVSEKWNPDLSTIYQVLVSIQSQILVDDPMTNEPLSETMAGTTEGAAKTAEYNARLQLLVMRHAMVDLLQHPPPGTADIVAAHFRLLRHRLADTVARWVRAAPTQELRAKLDEQAARLLGMLAKL